MEDMEGIPDLKNNLWKRQEQLDRWKTSEVNAASSSIRDREKSLIQFPDSFVFLAACSAFDEDEILRLIQKGADINTSNVDGLTALHQACIDDDLHRVKFLVDHGADLNAQDNEGWTPLHAASSCGYMDIAKSLVGRGANIAVVNNDGELPVDLAEGSEMTKYLNAEMDKQGIDVDAARNEEENLMLHDANQWLNTKKFDDRPHPKTGATALHVAASKGYVEVMKILLQAGADIEAKDVDGWTPLHAAAHWAQEEACQLLVENMCNMDAKNTWGQTPYDVADSDIETFLEDLKKQQVTMRKDQEEKRQQELTMRNSVLGRRRSSVTRLSTDQRQDLLSKNVEEERVQLERMRSQEPTPEEDEGRSESANTSSDELRSPGPASSSATANHVVAASSHQDDGKQQQQQETGNSANLPAAAVVAEPAVKTARDAEVIGETYGVQMRDKRGSRGTVSAEIPRTDVVPPAATDGQPAKTVAVASTASSTASVSTMTPSSRSSAPDVLGLSSAAAVPTKPAASSSAPAAVPVSSIVPPLSAAASSNSKPSAAVASTSVSTTPSVSTPVSTTPAVSAPAVSTPVSTTPAVSIPVSTTPAISAPVSTTPALAVVAALSTSTVTSARSSGSVVTSKTPLSTSTVASASDPLKTSSSAPAVFSSSSNSSGISTPFVRRNGSDVVPTPASTGAAVTTVTATSTAMAVTAPSTRKSVTEQPSTSSPTPAAVAPASIKDGISSPPTLLDASLANRRTSFEIPKRDSEKEVERKARARRAREERRSTQGVTKEDLEEASQRMSTVDSADGSSTDRRGSDSDGRVGGRVDQPLMPVASSAFRGADGTIKATSDEQPLAVVRPEVTRPSAAVTAASVNTASRPIDYRKLYEEEKLKNDRGSRQMEKLKAELSETKADLERTLLSGRDSGVVQSHLESRERRALERKISELEEEVKGVETLRAENQRLKQENGALIRVISKLSK